MNALVSSLNLLPAQDSAGQGHYGTHLVKNQAMPLTGFNAFEHDAVLSAAVQREAPWAAGRCQALGQLVGDEGVQELARLANRNLPELKTGSHRQSGGTGTAICAPETYAKRE